MGFQVVYCNKCGLPCVIREDQKYFTCRFCGFRVNANKCRVILQTDNLQEARRKAVEARDKLLREAYL